MRALLIIALLTAWFLPLIIAALYKLPHQGPIAVLSLLLGWTGAGWLAALVIAIGGASRATPPPPLGPQQPPRPPAPPPADPPPPPHPPPPGAGPRAGPAPRGAPAPRAAPAPGRSGAPRADPPGLAPRRSGALAPPCHNVLSDTVAVICSDASGTTGGVTP